MSTDNNYVFSFEVETRWTIPAKYTSRVTVYTDRVTVKRVGRVGNVPEEAVIYFDQVSTITYKKDTDYLLSYISFTGVSNSASQSIGGINIGKNMMLASSSANPWADPHGIVFRMDMYESTKRHYRRMLEVFEEYKKNHASPIVQAITTSESSLDKLKKLKELKDLGILSKEEYEEKRQKLLIEI